MGLPTNRCLLSGDSDTGGDTCDGDMVLGKEEGSYRDPEAGKAGTWAGQQQ